MGERLNMLKFNWKIACCQGLLASVWLVQISHAELIGHSLNNAHGNELSLDITQPKSQGNPVKNCPQLP